MLICNDEVITSCFDAAAEPELLSTYVDKIVSFVIMMSPWRGLRETPVTGCRDIFSTQFVNSSAMCRFVSPSIRHGCQPHRPGGRTIFICRMYDIPPCVHPFSLEDVSDHAESCQELDGIRYESIVSQAAIDKSAAAANLH